MTSYEIPPAPKPFHARLQQQAARYAPGRVGCTSVSNSELDLRAVKSSHPTADDKEYYIAFPPSGLPVHCEYRRRSAPNAVARCNRARKAACEREYLDAAIDIVLQLFTK
jgi:hypothetical protein